MMASQNEADGRGTYIIDIRLKRNTDKKAQEEEQEERGRF
jgi:hypothetical protein